MLRKWKKDRNYHVLGSWGQWGTCSHWWPLKSWGLWGTMPLKESFCLFSATKDHNDVQACTAAGSYVWDCCSAAAGLCVDISDSCYHRGLCRGLLSGTTPEAMLVFDSHVAIGTRWSRWQVLLPGAMKTFILELQVRAKSGPWPYKVCVGVLGLFLPLKAKWMPPGAGLPPGTHWHFAKLSLRPCQTG